MVATRVRSHPNARHSRRDSLPSAYGSSALCGRDTDGSAAPRREGITEASPPDESTRSARLGDDLSEMSGERTGHALCLGRRVGRRFGTLAQASANPGEAKWICHTGAQMGQTQSNHSRASRVADRSRSECELNRLEPPTRSDNSKERRSPSV